jgi:hypothetical protein
MMMQLLEAGGIPPLTDGIRRADEHNPRGYYELEAVKRLEHDASWVAAAHGMAVKVVYRLLPRLPAQLPYRVIFLERPLAEVCASQQEMLRGSRASAGEMDLERFEHLFGGELRRTLAWLAEQPRFRLHRVDYTRLLEDPPGVLAALERFLGGGLDVAAMQRAVVPSLHRQRLSSLTARRSAGAALPGGAPDPRER